MTTLAHDLYLNTPVLNAIDDSNIKHIRQVIQQIEKTGKRKIGICGLSFKAGTDDMRNSPIVNVIEALHGKGFDVRIFDSNVSLSRLIGKNKSVITEKLPHLNNMLQDDLSMLGEWAEVLVVSYRDNVFKSITVIPGQIIIDLVRIEELESCDNYIGLCW